jgi:hypothetical protein
LVQDKLNFIREPTPSLSSKSSHPECSSNNFTRVVGNVVNSSDLDYCDSIVENDQLSEAGTSNSTGRIELSRSLAMWSCTHNITHAALNDLLKTLQPFVAESLPLNSRTLLKTKVKVEVETMGAGQFYYFGISGNLRKRIQVGLESKEHDFPIIKEKSKKFRDRLISMSIGIDGLPVAKSNNKSFRPIMAKVDQSLIKEPFLIALYLGDKKPPVDSFLSEFVRELEYLESDGILVGTARYEVCVSAIIADAPAHSFIKCTKNHNASFGCDKCEVEGDWDGRVMFSEVNAKLRTDSSFRMQTNTEHHKGTSPLSVLSFGLVTQVPID